MLKSIKMIKVGFYMKVVTFNMRTLWNGDGINSFIHRIGLIYEKINAENPDVVGFQEMKENHYDVMKKLFPNYEFFGSGRHKNYNGEGLYTAFKKDLFTCVKSDIFWLSDTPKIKESRFETQSEYPRICIVNKLFNKETKKCVWIYNTHLDYLPLTDADKRNNEFDVRTLGIKCILNKMQENFDQDPVILMGDFNAYPQDDCVKLCKENFTDATDNLTTTFHAFGTKKEPLKIDYIFLSDELKDKFSPAYTWEDVKNGIYLSDHYPVAVEIDF